MGTVGRHWKCSLETKEKMRQAATLRQAAAAKKLWAQVDKKNGPIIYSKLGRCWLLPGSKPKTYGRHHKRAWTAKNGPIPKGKLVCHKCGNPPCIRLSHLFLGSRKDSALDTIKRGRRSGGALGWHHTPEAKKKIGNASKTPERRAKISKAMLGNKNSMGREVHHSKETRRKIGLASLGRQGMLGHKHSPETKEKMRQSALLRRQKTTRPKNQKHTSSGPDSISDS